jgi:hypothetical protein
MNARPSSVHHQCLHDLQFFKCLYELIDMDLMVLVGASAKDDESDDDGYCSGCLLPMDIAKAINKLDDLACNRREEAGPYAMDKHDIDGRWFLRTVVELQDLLKTVAQSNAAAMGYYE